VHKHVCPWWIGYLLASPLRRLFQDPHTILHPFVSEGMTVLEPGPGMGFFTLELARLVGTKGRVVAVDLQPRMLAGLRKRAQRAGLSDRIDARETGAASMGVDDLAGRVDLVVAFAVVHELPSAAGFFAEVHRALKAGGKVLVSEPAGRVSAEEFALTVGLAESAGLAALSRPSIARARSAMLVRSA
jgi:ubiquinone/menaquinone biosynthesis C-methylase UbiE